MFQFKSFQRRDLARAALHDGLILAAEPGLGKTLMAPSWAILKLGLHPQANGKLLPAQPVLIVAPENLHSQMMHDYQELFGAAWPGCTELDCQQTFFNLSLGNSELRIENSETLNDIQNSKFKIQNSPLKPGWYISSFTQIASNKVLDIPEVPDNDGIPDEELSKLMTFFNVTLTAAANHRLFVRSGVAQAPRLSQWAPPPAASASASPSPRFLRLKPDAPIPSGATEAGIHDKALDLCRDRRAILAAGVGEFREFPIQNSKFTIQCVFSPSLADLVRHAFGAVCIDEAVRIKSEDSIIGIGVRSLCPKYRLVLTGTPIKNRLPDIFFLAAWACDALDEANARWPYCAKQEGEMERFAQEFMVMGRDLTKERQEAEARGSRYVPPTENGFRSRRSKMRRGNPTAEVCNIHRLWKLLAPVVLRRRKADIGEDIVPKIRRPIIVPMGTMQAKVMRYHLAAEYLDKNGMPAIGAQLQALRSCAAAPCSPLLEDKGPVGDEDVPFPSPRKRGEGRGEMSNFIPGSTGDSPVPPGDPPGIIPPINSHSSHFRPYRSTNEFTPRLLAGLRVIEEILGRREQVVVASAFHEPLDAISRLLTQAGVAHDVLDGRMTAARRGRLAMEFKRGLAAGAKPVLLAGNRAMGEGNSWNLCNNLIQYCWDWAYDTAAQMMERVHRLNSMWPVNIYPIICTGTIDRKLESLLGEKTDSAELVLDGKLIGAVSEEVNLLQLLQLAHSEFTAEGTIDERECEAAWPALRARLAAAALALGGTGDPPVPLGDPPKDPTPVGRDSVEPSNDPAPIPPIPPISAVAAPPPDSRQICPVCRVWRPVYQRDDHRECASCGAPLSESAAPRRVLTLADLPRFHPRPAVAAVC